MNDLNLGDSFELPKNGLEGLKEKLNQAEHQELIETRVLRGTSVFLCATLMLLLGFGPFQKGILDNLEGREALKIVLFNQPVSGKTNLLKVDGQTTKISGTSKGIHFYWLNEN